MEGLIVRQKMHLSEDLSAFSPSFKSQTPRYFEQPNNTNTPGPGAYGIPSLDYQKTSKYHVETRKNHDCSRQFQWIFSSSRSKAFFSLDNNRNIGPGSYNPQEQQGSSHNAWAKGSRFAQQLNRTPAPGPGSYERETIEHKRAAQAVFKSKTPKVSLFQSTSKQQVMEEKLFCSFDQKKETDSRQTNKQRQKSYIFSSKVPRFLTQSSSFEAGPGSYELGPNSTSKKQDFPRIIRHTRKPTGESRAVRMNSEVGPGSYNMKKYEMSYVLENRGGHFSRETRFNFRHRKPAASTYMPGPGEYMQQRFSSIRLPAQSKGCRLRISRPHCSKTSVSGDLRSKKETQEPGFYELNNYNIGFKLQRQAEHQEKLKIMDVSMAPFFSKVPRFP